MIRNGIRAIVFTLGLLSGAGVYGQQAAAPKDVAAATTADKPAAAEPKVQADPALWVVKGPKATLYFFGSIHVMKPNVEWHTGKVNAALDASGTLLEEVADIDQTAAMQPLIQKYGLDPEHPLSTKISKEDLALIDAAIKQMGGPGEASLEPARPWLAGITVSVLPMLKAGYDMKSGVDITLAGQFREKKKPIQGLETVEEQLLFLSDMPLKDEVESLHVELKQLDHSVSDLDKIVVAWQKGDVESIGEIENEIFVKEYPELYKRLIVKRNATWAEKLSKMLQTGEGTTFVAVGAAHLAGPDSVLKQLEAKGFTVTKL